MAQYNNHCTLDLSQRGKKHAAVCCNFAHASIGDLSCMFRAHESIMLNAQTVDDNSLVARQLPIIDEQN